MESCAPHAVASSAFKTRVILLAGASIVSPSSRVNSSSSAKGMPGSTSQSEKILVSGASAPIDKVNTSIKGGELESVFVARSMVTVVRIPAGTV